MPYFFQAGRGPTSPLRTLDVRADDTDARDHLFQPSLALLPAALDHRGEAPVQDKAPKELVLDLRSRQSSISVLSRRRRSARGRKRTAQAEFSVSPRMLYEMARRYDEGRPSGGRQRCRLL